MNPERVKQLVAYIEKTEKELAKIKNELRNALLPAPLKEYETAKVELSRVMAHINEYADSISNSAFLVCDNLGVRNLYYAAKRKGGKGHYRTKFAYSLAEMFGQDVLVEHESHFVFEEKLYLEERMK